MFVAFAMSESHVRQGSLHLKLKFAKPPYKTLYLVLVRQVNKVTITWTPAKLVNEPKRDSFIVST